MKKVAVIMGSDSDWPVVKGACEQLQSFGIPFEAHILSAHRTPAAAADFAKSARKNGFGVLICAAGMAAHLAGAFAGNSTLPVIGIPMKGGAMDGLDALLATAASPWPLWPSTGLRTPLYWPPRFCLSPTTSWPPGWTRRGRAWPPRSPKRRRSSRPSWDSKRQPAHCGGAS